MKRIGISFSVLILALLVVLGSGRITIGKMICPMGMAAYTLGNAKDCCEKGDAATGCVIKSCCKLINVSYLLDDFSFSEKVKVSAKEFIFFPSSFMPLPRFSVEVSSSSLFSDISPHTAKEYLYFISSLLL